MPVAQLPAVESDRLAAVRRYDILDTPADGSFDRIAALAAETFDVPIAIVSVVDTDRIWFKSHHGLEVTQIDREPGLCASAILGSDPWIINDAPSDPRALANPLVAGEFGLRFYAGAPLTTHDGYNLGTLCVIDREPRSFTERETRQLTVLASIVMDELELRRSARLAVESSEQRRRDMEHLAEVLQSSLLPPTLPDIPHLFVAAHYHPASRFEVGGDFYDVFPIDDQTWGFVIGDVMGKGPQAAARTSAARYTIRAAAIHEEDPRRVLGTVNSALLAEPTAGADTPFVTALFARVEPSEGRTTVRFASAGHPLPTVVRVDGRVELVGEPGTMLGVFAVAESSEVVVELLAGDTLVMITDGVHDSGHPDRLQQQGLEAVLRGCRGLAAADVVRRVHAAAASAQRDDIAIVALTTQPAGHVRP
ncbi:MAG TPA: GAF domain-containing SpoIIE family protein phosphatase [Mycobacteriales bacterium]|nr:GAF domain-containing SpoIIE family protein phosphatase [Mycobacteriales bacterium]